MSDETKTVYACTWVEKLAEEDDFVHGVSGRPTLILSERCDLAAPTFGTLLEKIKTRFFLEEVSDLFLPGDDDGVSHIGVSQLETADGNLPSDRERDLWREGKFKLFLCDYTFGVESRQVRPLTPDEVAAVAATH